MQRTPGIMMRVLVVEDDPSVRHMVDRLLTGRGYFVLTAPSAELADALLLDYGAMPDLAILDLGLPGIAGSEYGDRLAHRFPNIRLIFMTGWTERLAKPEFRRGTLLTKPFASGTLLELVSGLATAQES